MTTRTTRQIVASVVRFHLVLALMLAFAISATAQDSAAINATGAQAVKGWGCYPSYFDSSQPNNTADIFDKPAIQDAIYNLGITYIRVSLDNRLYVSGTALTGTNTIVLNQAAVTDLANQIKIAQAHGVNNYIMSCWSPPGVWKTNGSINGGCLLVADEPYYVNYYIAVIQAMQAAGVGLPVNISVQNEPDLATAYPSCDYVHDTQTGGGYGLWRKLVEDMHAALVANGMSTVQVVGPEATDTDDDIQLLGANPNFGMMSDPTFSAALGAYATHGYGENIWLGIRQGERDYPRDGWITEWSIDSNSNDGGTENGWTLDAMAHMASNFIDIPYNYWTWWAAWNSASTPQGTTLIAGTQTPVLSERYYCFQKLWTTVRPGWVVHSMSCSDTNYTTINTAQNTWETLVDLASFWDPAGDACVTMLVNKTSSTTSMTVTGLVGTSFSAFQSDATHNMVNTANGSVSSGAATVSLAPTSVTFLVTTSAVLPAISGMVAEPSNPGVTLTWPVSYGANSYNIKRATTSAGPFTTVGSTTNALTYTDATAVAGTTYYYSVTAVNPSGESANSNLVSVLVPFIAQDIGDAYVQDGSYTGTNTGSSPDLTVKASTTAGYNREAYLQFNVSGLASATSVQIWLVPDYVGTDAYTSAVNFGYEVLTNDGWNESTITWTNSRSLNPNPHAPFATYNGGYYLGTSVILDVTTQAKARAGIDGLLSLHIYSLSNPSDANAGVNFASKENTTASWHPVLVYTNAPSTREPVADAYVRDGTYANTNYGTDPDLSVKLDATGYQRESFLRFNVADLANATSVKLKLTPDTVGPAPTTIVYDTVPTNTWIETGTGGITWNTKPASSGSPFATVTGYAAGTPVEIDITAQAKAAATSGGLLSIRMYGTVLGSNNWVNFISRDNTNTTAHPVIEYY
jgi:O-glycosyl hydrolase